MVLLLILAAIMVYGYLAQRSANAHPEKPAANVSTSSSAPAVQFAIDMAADWALALYVWAGVRRRGGRWIDLIGGRWASWRDVAIDVAWFIPFWFLWEATARATWWLIGPPASQGANFAFPPHGVINIAAWIALSLTAGFCEEVVFRGYLQKQFHVLTGSALAALLIQALIFGGLHIYQGLKPTVVISVLGLLYGLLALQRGNLRAAMLSHAWSDLFEGYFKFVLPPIFR